MSGAAAGTTFRAEAWLGSPLRTGAGELLLAGRLRNAPGIEPGAMRVLGSYALVLVVEGRGYYRDARGRESALQPGAAVWVYPEIPHAYGPVGDGGWTQVYTVMAGPQFDLWRKSGLLLPERPVWSVGAPEYWAGRLAAVFAPEGGGEETAAWRALGRLLEVVTELRAAAAATEASGRRDDWLERSRRTLGQRRAGRWATPQEAAREAGLSYENFRKRFAAATGEAPGHYQKRRRLEAACAAIYAGERTLKDIADELGFCDVFHFSKAFKQVIGASPSEYRRRVRGS